MQLITDDEKQEKKFCNIDMNLQDIKDMGVVVVMEQKFNFNGGTFNGPVVGINNGDINQNLQIIKEIEPDLANLLMQLEQEQLTCYHAKKVVSNIAELKNVEEKEKKTLADRVVDNAGKLVVVAEASSKLYPIAVKAFELIKQIFI